MTDLSDFTAWQAQLLGAVEVAATAMEQSVSEFVELRTDEHRGFEADTRAAARICVDALVEAGWRPPGSEAPGAGLLRAEHVSGVRVEAGPSSPVVSPGPGPVDPIPEVWHLIQLYGAGSFGYLKMTATAQDGRIHREDGRGDWEPFYDDEGRPVWFRVSREVAESWSGDEEEQLTAGDELAIAAAAVARLVPEGAERFRVQRAVRAWEEAR